MKTSVKAALAAVLALGILCTVGLVRDVAGADTTTSSTTTSTTAPDGSTTTTTTPSCTKGYALQKTIAAAVPGSTVKLAGCYTTTGTVDISGTSDLTISGSATLTQTVLGPRVIQQPVLLLDGNTGDTITGLTVAGSYAGSSGGSAYEGDAGVLAEDNHDMTLSVNVRNVQGDFVDLYPATDHALNTGIVWTGSTFSNAGYHGLVPEAVDGVTFSDDKFSKIAVDAIDAENDIYSTTFSNGQPTFAAVDDFTVSNSTFYKWGYDLYASLQPQLPGVQEQGVRIIDDRLSGGAPFVQIIGAATTVARYQTSGIAIVGNVASGPLRDTASGSNQPFTGSAMTVKDASNVTVLANQLPIYYGTKPVLGFITANGVDGLTVASNLLPGALGVVNPSRSARNTSTSVCGNSYGVNAATTDAVCP